MLRRHTGNEAVDLLKALGRDAEPAVAAAAVARLNGFDEDVPYTHAWKYRDYVVRAFNADKPFDQFIREQIAGDLLPPTPDPTEAAERATALGYLASGRNCWPSRTSKRCCSTLPTSNSTPSAGG